MVSKFCNYFVFYVINAELIIYLLVSFNLHIREGKVDDKIEALIIQ